MRGMIIVILSLFAQVAVAKTVINNDVRHLEKEVYESIHESLNQYLGKDNFSVFVKLQAGSKEEPKASADFDIGYLPQPLVAGGKTAKEVVIENAIVKVFVFKKIPSRTLQTVKDLAKSATHGMASNVNVLVSEKSVDPQTPPPESKVEESPPEKSFWEKLLNDTSSLSKMFIAFITAGTVLLVTFLAFKLLKAVITSLESMTKEIVSSLKPKEALTEKTIEDDTKNNTKIESSEESSELFQKNIAAFEDVLCNNPHLFLKSLNIDSEDDVLGMRSLMIRVSKEAYEKLKSSIAENHLKKLVERHADESMTSQKFHIWVNNLRERMSVEELKVTNAFDKKLDPELSRQLKLVAPQTLIQVARKLKTTLPLKICLEYLPTGENEKFTSSLSETEWKEILQPSHYVVQELNETAQMMLGLTADNSASEAISPSLLATIFKIIETKKIGEDDEFLKQVCAHSIGLEEIVSKEIWTYKKMDLIDDKDLMKYFLELDQEQRFLMLIALPASCMERFLKFIQEGKSKIILQDQISRFALNADKEKVVAGTKVAKSFVAMLKTSFEEGKLQIHELPSLKMVA
jgi:hypothetical protein